VSNGSKRLGDQTNVVDNNDVYPSHGLDLYTTLSAPSPPQSTPLTTVRKNAYGGPLNVIVQSPVSRTNHSLRLDKLHQLRRENKRLTCQHNAVNFPLLGKTHRLLQVGGTDIGLC